MMWYFRYTNATNHRARAWVNMILDIEPSTFIIFQTAYEQFAIEALKWVELTIFSNQQEKNLS